MTITASPTTVTIAGAAVSASAWFHTSDPGEFAVDYPTGITGPATVTAEGSRVWTLNNSRREDGWNAPAAASAIMKGRHGQTIGIELDLADILPYTSTGTAYTEVSTLVRNYQVSDAAISWQLMVWSYIGVSTVYLMRNSQAGLLVSINPASYVKSILRMTLVFPAELSTTINIRYKLDAGSITAASNAPAAIAGEHAGTCQTAFYGSKRFFYAPSALSTAQQDLFLNGGMPSDACTVQYSGAEEGSIVYDSSGNGNDGVYGLDATHLVSGVVRRTTDTGFTSPLVEVPIVIAADCAAGVKNITLRRTRVGIPARVPALADAVVYDDGVIPVTVAVTAEAVTIGPDTTLQVASYPATFDLILSGNYDGAATVVSDDPNLVPASPVTISGGVAVVACTVAADVTGATVTATGPGGDTDACSVTVAEVPEPDELLSIGPDIDAEVESYPDAIMLLLTSNVDGDVEIVSDDANLIPMSPVTVIDGKTEVACLVLADVTGATVTASRTPGPTDSCSVSVSDVLTDDWIAVGPNQRTRIEGKRIVWPIRVRSSKDGAFTATADPATGIVISGPFILASGACNITAQPTQAGTWTLTVTQDGRTDAVTLEALAPVAQPTVRQYNLSADIDGFFEYVNRRCGLRPRFTAANVQDVRAEHSTDRTYSRYAQGTGQPGSVFGAVALSYQVMISYSSATMAEQDLGVLREEADRYSWNCIGFSMTAQTMFEPIKMMPRLTLTLNFDIIPEVR